MKFRIAIFALLSLCATGCVRYVQVPSPAKPEIIAVEPIKSGFTPPSGWQAVENKFAYIAVPKDWEQIEIEDDDDERAHRNYADPKHQFVLTLGYEDEDENLRSYVGNVIKTLSRDHDSRLISARKVNIDEIPAAQLLIRKNNTVAISHILVKDSHAFQINCLSNVSRADELNDLCSKIVVTFKFKK